MSRDLLSFHPFRAEGSEALDGMAAAWLPGPRQRALIAGWLPGESPVFELALLDGDDFKPLWSGVSDRRLGPADMVVGPKDALVLVKGTALLRIDTSSGTAHEETPSRRPDRIFPDGSGALAVFSDRNGVVSVSKLDANDKWTQVAEPRRGPALGPCQEVSLLCEDAAGRLLLAADDASQGFQLWREDEPGKWNHLVRDGFARRAFNAAVLAGVRWGDKVALAIGATSAIRTALFGLRMPGEIILLAVDGTIDLVCGELRPGPTDLLVPRLSARAMDEMRLGEVVRLDVVGELLVANVRGNGDQLSIYTITPDLVVTEIAAVTGAVHALIGDRTGVRALIAGD